MHPEVFTFDDLATDTVEAAVPEFGGVARDIVTVTEEDGSSRQMLSVTKADVLILGLVLPLSTRTLRVTLWVPVHNL